MSKVIIRKKANLNYRLFAICPGGLEGMLRKELNALQFSPKGDYPGGIEFEGDLEKAYVACLSLRTASRVLLLLKETQKIANPDDLYKAMGEVEWFRVFSNNCTFAVYLTETHSKQRRDPINLQYWALKAKDALADQFMARFGARPNVDRKEPDIVIRMHLHDDTLKIYLDLSGKSLHERGYRGPAGEAPLKENLAAGMLLLADWDQKLKEKIPFFDPFCGSGTLLIEAAMMATKTPPGMYRQHFGFFSWKDHQPKLFEQVRERLLAARVLDAGQVPLIIGSDLNPAAIRSAQENIERAGFADLIKLNIGAFEKTTAFAPKGLIVSNPPYGVRIGSKDDGLGKLYQEMGSTFKHQYKNWSAGVISSDKTLLQAIGLKPSLKPLLHNGGLDSYFFIFNLY